MLAAFSGENHMRLYPGKRAPSLAVFLLVVLTACAPAAAPSPTATSAPSAPTPEPAAKAASPAVSPAPSPAAPAAGRSIVVGMPVSPPNLPHIGVYLAKELGYFSEEGLDVDIKDFQSGVQVLRGGMAGGIDVIGASSEPVIAAIAQGAPLKVIYSYAHKLTVAMVVQEGINSPADLRGKKVGIQEVGAFREVMSRIVLQSAGLTERDVNYVPLAAAGYIPGLVAGQIDTAILHVDQILNAQQRKPELRQLVKLWELLPDYFYGTFIMSPQKMSEDPTLGPRFVKAVMRAHRFLYMEKSRTVEIASRITTVPANVVAPAYDQLTAAGAFPVNEGMPPESIANTIKKLEELGTLQAGQAVAPDQLVDRRPAEEAVRTLGPMTGDPRWQ
jgi:NitT/TauT family transport system substrate-binding protein